MQLPFSSTAMTESSFGRVSGSTPVGLYAPTMMSMVASVKVSKPPSSASTCGSTLPGMNAREKSMFAMTLPPLACTAAAISATRFAPTIVVSSWVVSTGTPVTVSTSVTTLPSQMSSSR